MNRILMMLAAGLLAFSCWAAEAVDINIASAEEIAAALKGVGRTKAEAIVRYRETNGKFKFIDELVNVKGIGLRTVDINREVILLDGKKGGEPESP
jgi:competence protein ComEA